jgi:phosphoglycerate dehydrogenase-like enzyme
MRKSCSRKRAAGTTLRKRRRPAGPGSLRWLHVVGAGIDGYPDWIRAVPAITCGRGVNANAIAEYVLGAILLHDKRFLECVITDAADWRPLSLRGLSGKTLGLLGLGAIGTEVARRAQAFDMRIKAFRRSGAAPTDKAVAATALTSFGATCSLLVLPLLVWPTRR